MDCNTCNDLLLDLAYGELDEVREAAVRKHLETCVECKSALARIERGRRLARELPRESAPPISVALRAAIEAGVPAGASAGASGSVIPLPRSDRRMARWFERAGEFAMRRQVAMAAVFLLMIGVGLIFYQTHPRPSDAPDVRTPDVVPAVEVSNDPGVASAPQASARRPAPPLRQAELARDQHAHSAPSPAAAVAAHDAPAVVPQARVSAAQSAAPAREIAQVAAPPPSDTTVAMQGSGYRQQAAHSTGDVPGDESQPTVAMANGTTALDDGRGSMNALGGSGAAPVVNGTIANNSAGGRASGQTNRAGPTIADLQTQLSGARDEATRNRLRFQLATLYQQAGRDEDARAYLQAVSGAEQPRAQTEIAAISLRLQQRNANMQAAAAQAATAQVASAPAASPPSPPAAVAPAPANTASSVATAPAQTNYPGSTGSESNSNSSVRRPAMRHAGHRAPQPSTPAEYDSNLGL